MMTTTASSTSPTDLAAVPLERIESEITELAAHINAATCRWLCLVGELDRREGWASWGAKSCAHWLAWRCSVSPNAAREHVRVARRLRDLPLVRAAFASGELSYSKVRALTRVAGEEAGEETEEELVGIARHATAAQLEEMVRSYRRASRAVELEDARTRHDARSLVYFHDDDGSLVIKARLAPEEGAVVVAALRAAAESIECPAEHEDVSAETPTPHPLRSPQRNADALVVVAESFVSAGASTTAKPHEVVVHVDVDELRAAGRCELEDGSRIPPETARRLGCDADVVMLLERDGEPLSVGRRTRAIPRRIRRALEARDGRCRFPGCNQRRFVDAHHVRHWADGGETSLDNLVQLCRFHHRFVHEGGCTVAKTPAGELAFTLPGGSRIFDTAESVAGHADELRRHNVAAGLLIDDETAVPAGAGERMDYEVAVGWLLQEQAAAA